MLKVYLASDNPVKVAAVQKVIPEYPVYPQAVKTGCPEQPLSAAETLAGAKARAEALPTGAIRIGLESGVTRFAGGYFLLNFGCLITEDDRYIYGASYALPLPEAIGAALYTEQKPLNIVAGRYFDAPELGRTGGIVQYLTAGALSREAVMENLVKILWGQYRREQCAE